MSSLSIPSRGMLPPPAITDFLNSPMIGMTPKGKQGSEFSQVFSETLQSQAIDVRFSAHAQQRLESRGINLDQEDIQRLDQAIDQAEEKGAHNSLIVLDNNAFVVNVDKRTVVTAIDSPNASRNVFTKIDSTVFA